MSKPEHITPTMDQLWCLPQTLDAKDVGAWAEWIKALPPEQQATLAAAMDKVQPNIDQFMITAAKFCADNDLPNPEDILNGKDPDDDKA